MLFSELDRKLCRALCDLPSKFSNRYTPVARDTLLDTLFRSLTNDRPEYLSLLFPRGFPASYKLQEVQAIEDCAEYTPAAKGYPCGHIFKQGEASYHCMTCTDDNTCVLCSRCFDSSDHEGHQFTISLSGGNSGCCDCGDMETWKRPVNCAIHSITNPSEEPQSPGAGCPEDLKDAIRTTVARALDYFCDVISCSPENLRTVKTAESIKHDTDCSRLGTKWYEPGDGFDPAPEYCLVLWNDEKHTIQEFEDQVTRACRQTKRFGRTKAQEANDIGRSVIEHSRDLEELIRKSKIIEQIKVTVSIRSSRDTFREQMCGTIVEWLSDIAKCSIGNDNQILRHTICDQMLRPWRMGSEAYNAKVGKDGIEDREKSDREPRHALSWFVRRARRQAATAPTFENSDDDDDFTGIDEVDPADEEVGDDDEEDEEEDDVADGDEDDQMEVEEDMDGDDMSFDGAGDGMDTDHDGDYLDIAEATLAGYPPPPPPPVRRQQDQQGSELTPTESEAGDVSFPNEDRTRNFMNVPKTPQAGRRTVTGGHQPNYWAIRPTGYSVDRTDVPTHEDLSKNIRLDSMILFDLRLWKQTRIRLRDLYISTVVNVPKFKRILGLRFSGLYTTLSQLYLVADREPDHSIINLSLQMLTSPSITEEVLERGNFLTNLMAILYTFLTTRQVGFPKDVTSTATLAFDAGSVTNRRLYHFLTDLRYFLASEFVQKKVRTEKQYLLQFLDLAKLCQGICPNVRAVGEHVEYETDAWISASLLTKEINKLCRQFAESFSNSGGKKVLQTESTQQAIFHTAYVAIVNSVGFERQRFDQCEIKDLTRFKTIGPYEIAGTQLMGLRSYRVVDFKVDKGAISFHHALHYTLSWLLECGKHAPHATKMLHDAARRFTEEQKNNEYVKETFRNTDDVLLCMFDYPLRVCAWLAQMKAGMWVRNGMSLRHQMGQYKGVTQRDVGYHRDLLLLQTALVTCDPSRVLASMIDRYGLEHWMGGSFKSPSAYEDPQMVDVAEDFVHLLIILLTDRASLTPEDHGENSQSTAVRKDIIHTLCFKPLSYSDLNARLTERAQETPEFQSLLSSMTNFRGPEGLHDSGLFELKPEFLAELDPYNSNFNKNQRDEAEHIYKEWMAKQVNKSRIDIVLEPKIQRITNGAYRNLAAFTSKPLFAHIIYSMLKYSLDGHLETPDIPKTRLEAFLQDVLQLTLLATLEDGTNEDDFTEESMDSFVRYALNAGQSGSKTKAGSIISLLQKISTMEEYASCRAKIKHILRLFVRKRARDFERSTAHLEFPYGPLDTASPANVELEIEAKKKQALERKAKVMAQFQQQQQNFIESQGAIDWGESDLSDIEVETQLPVAATSWKYPTGVCIQCREETNDSRLYGTFSMLVESNVLRQTDVRDPDWVREILTIPESLDRSNENFRPFGVSGENHKPVRRFDAEGNELVTDRQGLGKGWPVHHVMRGPVSTGCGHIMHFSCFENYYNSVMRRQAHQVARNHPERTAQKEFVCPLCKALGNAFVPIVWKAVDESYPGALASDQSLDHFLDIALPPKLELQRHQIEKKEPLGLHSHQEALAKFSTGDFNLSILQWQRGEKPLSPTGLSWAERPDMAAFAELSRIYVRLRDTLNVVRLSQSGDSSPSAMSLDHFDLLISSLGRTIATTEIAYRGQPTEPGSTILNRIPQQTLTHIRILSSTAKSYAAMNAITVQASSESSFRKVEMRHFRQLFVAYARVDMMANSWSPRPLLQEDSFTFLAECSLVLCSVLKLEIRHTLHLCYVAEILRVILVYMFNPEVLSLAAFQLQALPGPDPSASEINAIKGVLDWVIRELTTGPSQVGIPTSVFSRLPASYSPDYDNYLKALYRVTNNYALPFLRKAVILLHVSHGVNFPAVSGDITASELENLSQLLCLPSLPTVLSDFGEYSGKSTLKSLASGWLQHLAAFAGEKQVDATSHGDMRIPSPTKVITSNFSYDLTADMKLLHPCPLELIGLPKYYDVLMEESHRRRCPTTGKELTDPSLCLFCGEIFCSQAVCCMSADKKRGGCNLHVEKCSNPIGLFLNIRKCMILFLHIVPPSAIAAERHHNRGIVPGGSTSTSNGSWFAAPYLTKHGEIDPGLRQRHQLILSQKRYDKLLRDAWLMVNATVWSTIARKLEGEVNGGGWESI